MALAQRHNRPAAAAVTVRRSGAVAAALLTRARSRPPATAAAAQQQQATAAAATTATGGVATQPMEPPYVALVTGGSKGIGRALAEEFLRAGDSVVICARSADAVDAAVKQLRDEFGADRVAGRTCDVARADDVRALAAFASDSFGRVDLWLNNAGTNAYSYAPLLESSDADLERIVDTNVLGVMLCCREAIKLMRSQPRGGHVFNMDGAGADGGATPRFAAYGATKRSLVQLGKSLEAELKLLGIKNVGVHNLSPGMVTTELLMSGADTPVAKFFINCLAEEPADVAAYLVPRVRAVPREAAAAAAGPFGLGGALPSLNGGGGGGGGSNGSNGAAATTYAVGSGTYVQYLTKPKAYAQILRRLVLGERKNRFVREDQKFP